VSLNHSASSYSSGVPAALWRRLAAFGYDLLLLAALAFCFTWAVLLVRGGREIPPGSVWFEASLLGVAALFFCGFWARGGQTLGMRAWKIRVVASDGGRVGWLRSAARFAAALVSLMPAGLGIWWILLDERKRGWHDLWTDTLVVEEVSEHAPKPRP
jgi:uncharacterized RDD family membrane protein YckC